MEYKPVTQDIIGRLRQITGDANVITDREAMHDYSHDEYALDHIRKFPEAVVKPRSTEEVASIVRLMNSEKIPLTTRGGGTGLCGGCVPQFGGVVMSMENMNRILEIDVKNLTATVESGLMLMHFYPALEEKGLFFPPHPGDESATIGGVIATNAGGARAVKYGVIRNFIKGIEIVLADGEVLNFGGKFIKDSSGYSLLHLMIGSEGTLGIVTKATIALMPPSKAMMTLVAPYEHIHDAMSTVPAILQSGFFPMAIEFVDRETVEISGDFINKQWPCRMGSAHLMIIIEGNSEDDLLADAERLSGICLENKAMDVFVADTREKQSQILEIRSGIYEAMKNHTLEILDITVPRSRIAEFVDEVGRYAEKMKTWLPTYGHAADGNVHTHLMRSRWESGAWKEMEGWEEKFPEARKALHEMGKKYQGICSGEHGIGMVKKEYLGMFLDKKHIDLMKGIKKVFDPNGILNPGKIFD